MGEKKDPDAKNNISTDGLDDFFSDLGDEAIDGDYDEIDQYIDEVMALLEHYGDFSGGIIRLNTIFNYLQKGNFPHITQQECFEIISRLRTNHVIFDEITYEDIPDFYLYIFKEIQISDEMKFLIKQFITSNKFSIDQLLMKEELKPIPVKALLMEGDRLHLIKKEDNKYYIPALSSLQ